MNLFPYTYAVYGISPDWHLAFGGDIPYTGDGPWAYFANNEVWPSSVAHLTVQGKEIIVETAGRYSTQYANVLRNVEIATGHRFVTKDKVRELIISNFDRFSREQCWKVIEHIESNVIGYHHAARRVYKLRDIVKSLRGISRMRCLSCRKRYIYWDSDEKQYGSHCSAVCRLWPRYLWSLIKLYGPLDDHESMKAARKQWDALCEQRSVLERFRGMVRDMNTCAANEFGSR